MAQPENESEFSSKFSTLNVNAMEFVPSFCTSPPPPPSSAAQPAAAVSPPSNTTPSPTGGAGSGEASTTAATAAAANTTTPVDITPTAVTPPPQPQPPPPSSSVAVAAATPPSPTPQSVAAAATTPVDEPLITAAVTDGGAAAGEVGGEEQREQESTITSSTTTMATAATTEVLADKTPESDPLDSWDVEEEAATTPEDEEVDDLDEENEDKITISKKKLPKLEENRSKKEHVNVVFIGHVDAGKSTIGGQIMALTGMVDKRTLEKYEREAREKSRESWYLSFALDTNQEEREKGKTVEVGRAYFESERKHFTILDAPGHKSFVPNMIGGAAQADLAVLVLSARKGEFETGFDRGGQTREHAMLAKTAGVKHLVVLVNKMDDPTVNWDEGRFNECRDKILPYLKKLGFNPTKDLTFMPVSGQNGTNVKELDQILCPWYSGLAFIPFIDQLPSLNRKQEGPFIMPIVDKYKDMGTVVMGKVESGSVKKGQNMLVMPNRTPVSVDQLWSDDDEVTSVGPGENVKVKLKGIEEDDVSPGFVLCDSVSPITTGKKFDAQVVILEHKSIICAGYSAVMHIHCAAEEITVNALICLVDKKTGEKSKTRPRFVKQDQVAIMRIECSGMICMEQFKLFPQMGRFTLRDENKTIAIGKVLKVIE